MGPRVPPWCLLVVALTSGCDGLATLKQGLQDDTATLRIDVSPATGATVVIDGFELGGATSPVVREGLAAGSHRLEVRAPGYHPFSTPITLRPGQRLTMPLALRALPSAAGPAPSAAPPPR